MSRLHQFVTVLVVFLLLFEIGRTPLEGRDKPAAETQQVTPLGVLQAEPLAYLGKSVRCVVQIQSLPESWNPFVTRFGTRDYRALSVWTDEQILWDAQAFQKPFGLVFVRRLSEADLELASAKPYQRYELVAKVSQVFLGRPWIEIESAKRLPEETGEGTVIHAARAVALLIQEHWALAAEEFDRALDSPLLPARAREELERLKQACVDAETHK